MELRSFKLRLRDSHVRVVPKTDARGCPFSGPGADLFGADAAEAFRLAAPLCDLLIARGADAHALSDDKSTPAMLAFARGFTDLGTKLAAVSDDE